MACIVCMFDLVNQVVMSDDEKELLKEMLAFFEPGQAEKEMLALLEKGQAERQESLSRVQKAEESLSRVSVLLSQACPRAGESASVQSQAAPAAPQSKASRMRQWVDANRNANTRRAYESGWKGFARYLQEEGVGETELREEDIADYLRVRLEEQRVAAATLAADRAAIGDRLKFTPLKGLHLAPLVCETLRICMNGAAQSVQKQHMSSELMREWVALQEESGRAEAREAWMERRNLALLLLMMAGMLRESEAVALRVDDLQLEQSTETGVGKAAAEVAEPRASTALLLTIRSSKTDQAGKGSTVVLSANSEEPALCPVRRVQEYLLARKQAGVNSEFLFCRQDGGALSPSTPCGIVQRMVAAVNERAKRLEGAEDKWGPPTAYGSHSMRRGGVTEARANGVDMLDIQRHGRWSSLAVLGYVGPTREEQLGVTQQMFRSPAASPSKTAPASGGSGARAATARRKLVFPARTVDFKLALAAKAAKEAAASGSGAARADAESEERKSEASVKLPEQSLSSATGAPPASGALVSRSAKRKSRALSSSSESSDGESSLLAAQEFESWQAGYGSDASAAASERSNGERRASAEADFDSDAAPPRKRNRPTRARLAGGARHAAADTKEKARVKQGQKSKAKSNASKANKK